MTRNEINAALTIYEAACFKHNDAIKDYDFALRQFRDGRMEYAEFGAAQAARKAADAEYDIAFLAASELPEVASDDVIEGDDSADQLAFL
jgi:hypothetical protein